MEEFVFTYPEPGRELITALELLRSNENEMMKYKLINEALGVAIWDMAVDCEDPVNPCNHVIWSDELRQMLGFADEHDFPNELSSWIGLLHPEDKEEAIKAFEAHLLDSEGTNPYDIEHRLMKKDGGYSYFRAAGKTIRDDNGRPIRSAGAIMEIEETKSPPGYPNSLDKDEETANWAKIDFLSTMVHEIRTPINEILRITKTQLQKGALKKAAREAFDKINAAGNLLLGIINDIVDLSEIGAGIEEDGPEAISETLGIAGIAGITGITASRTSRTARASRTARTSTKTIRT